MKIKGKKQDEAFLKPVEHQQKTKLIEGNFSKDLESSEIKNELNEIKKFEEQTNRNVLIYESSKCKYDFRNIPTIRSFGDIIFNVKIAISETDRKPSQLLEVISQINDKVRPRSKADKNKKTNTYKSTNAVYECRK